jgi:hypothetical protein
MLLEVQNVSVVAVNKIRNRGVQPFAVGALHQQDGGIFQRYSGIQLGPIISRNAFGVAQEAEPA